MDIIPCKEHLIPRVWDKMTDDKLVRQLFFDGCITDLSGFETFMNKRHSFVCLEEDEPLSLFWLTDIYNGRAVVHFCFFKDCLKQKNKSREIGREMLTWIFGLNLNDKYMFRVLLGYTPETKRLAIKYAKDLGFTECGHIPDYFYNYYHNRPEGAVVTYKPNNRMDNHEDI